MKQKKSVLMIGMLVLLIGIIGMVTGCHNLHSHIGGSVPLYKKSFWITYDLIDCDYNESGNYYYWNLPSQKVIEGEEVELAKDGDKHCKLEYVKHKAGKQIKGWSKNADGSTKDYDFGQKIKPTSNMTLYPALSKYGIGDEIYGKTVIYVRRSAKDKYKKYFVTGTDWRYVAADVNAAKNSEKRQWSSYAENIITSDAVGAGKENTTKILLKHNSDTSANNAAKYCKEISENSYLPSEAEVFLIYDAIKSGKINGLPTSAQIEYSYGLHGHDSAYFWTSTQFDKKNAYAVNLYHYEGTKENKSKTEKPAYVCPVVYYDDDGNIVK